MVGVVEICAAAPVYSVRVAVTSIALGLAILAWGISGPPAVQPAPHLAHTILLNLAACCWSPQVRVEAGCRVQQVADYLKPYGLSLQNYASIREQQIGGYTQVGLHTSTSEQTILQTLPA